MLVGDAWLLIAALEGLRQPRIPRGGRGRPPDGRRDGGATRIWTSYLERPDDLPNSEAAVAPSASRVISEMSPREITQ